MKGCIKMSSKKNFTLVVESKYHRSIEIAHEKAQQLFGQVSSIDSGVGQRIHFFIIAPAMYKDLSEDSQLEQAAQQAFIDWCEDENKRAAKPVYKLSQVDY